jgi:hypothetical protein
MKVLPRVIRNHEWDPMTKSTTTLFTAALLACGVVHAAFSGESHDGYQHHGHDTSGIEMGFSAGYYHLDQENDDAPGLHIHLSKRLQHEGLLKHVALGVGGEVIFADEAHYAVMLPLFVYPWKGLALSVAPSVVCANHEDDWETQYATHLEAAYVFETGEYDIGPVVGYSISNEDKHYMLGLHVGVHF